MSKVLIASVDSIISPTTNQPYEGVTQALQHLNDSGDSICFISHQLSKLKLAKKHFGFAYIAFRKDARALLEKNEGKYFVILGSHEVDMILAANYKLLLLNPQWTEIKDDKVEKYGLKVNNPYMLTKVLDIIKNQSTWYYNLNVGDNVRVLALTNANTYRGAHSPEEKVLVDGFRKLLKDGDSRYLKVLLFHFLSAIANNYEFREVQDWAIMPSSGLELNEDMVEFKERARYLMGGKKPQPLLIRHTPTSKSHKTSKEERLRVACSKHFETIHLNPHYKGKLRGRTVCVLDDYLTNGISFETIRNLLLSQGVEKLIFVALGTFDNPYQQNNYELSSNVFQPGYNYKLLSKKTMLGKTNQQAIKEIEALYKIINS